MNPPMPDEIQMLIETKIGDPECDPTLTECPRCHNNIFQCDGEFKSKDTALARLKLEHMREFFEIMERSHWFSGDTPKWMKAECRQRINGIDDILKMWNVERKNEG